MTERDEAYKKCKSTGYWKRLSPEGIGVYHVGFNDGWEEAIKHTEEVDDTI